MKTAAFVAVGLLLVGAVAAFGMQIESYDELEELRQESGRPIAPFVGEEDFAEWQAMHEERMAMHEERMELHERIREIKESGTYADLEALRSETDHPVAPWVSEEEFVEWQEMEPRGNGGRGGMGRHGGMRGHMAGHGCPFQ